MSHRIGFAGSDCRNGNGMTEIELVSRIDKDRVEQTTPVAESLVEKN